jgi:hypothetical protein
LDSDENGIEGNEGNSNVGNKSGISTPANATKMDPLIKSCKN